MLVSIGDIYTKNSQPQISNRNPGEKYNVTCKVLGFLVLYFFLQTFFWMNVLSYDIWRKFTR